jgi:hypothetical protein
MGLSVTCSWRVDCFGGLRSFGFNTWNRRKLKFSFFFCFFSPVISLIIVETFDFVFLFSSIHILHLSPVHSIYCFLASPLNCPNFPSSNISEWMCVECKVMYFNKLVSFVGFAEMCATLGNREWFYTTWQIVIFVLYVTRASSILLFLVYKIPRLVRNTDKWHYRSLYCFCALMSCGHV